MESFDQRFSATLDAFKAVASDKRIRDRKERLLDLQRWVQDVFGENSRKDVAGRRLLANLCLEEVIEISDNPDEQQAVSIEVLGLLEEVASKLDRALDQAAQDPRNDMQRECLRHLFFCASGCLTIISPGNSATPISATTLHMVVEAGMKAMQIVFGSERWCELASEERWCEIVELYADFVKGLVEAVTTQEPKSCSLMISMRTKLLEIGVRLAGGKSSTFLEVTWTSIVALLLHEHSGATGEEGEEGEEVLSIMGQKLKEALSRKEKDPIKVASFWLVLIGKLLPSYPKAFQGKVAVLSRQALSNLPKEETMHAHGDQQAQASVILLLLGESPEMPPQLRHMLVPCFKWMLKTLTVDFFHQAFGAITFSNAQPILCSVFLAKKTFSRGEKQQALEGSLSEILGAIWGAVLSKSSSRMQEIHIGALFSMLSNLMVGCLVNASIDSETTLLAFLHARLLQECNEEVQQRMWGRVFDTENIMSLHRTAVGYVVFEACYQPIPHKCQASKWARVALKTLQQVRSIA
ncbi:hypothetical protein BSKO_13891 [Bryopsis sp. KO-2023]|nr:hypothetical protein BSKO_13891 [Bryopsis sp. KO-2023]